MAEVEVIKAVDGPILRKRDYEGNPLVITRQRVAAYVRVSTDDDEQLESFLPEDRSAGKLERNASWLSSYTGLDLYVDRPRETRSLYRK